MYVVLDLQPGRASLLAQARRYRSLLRLPNVGLALDPEWKLQTGELPLRQIGSVTSTEINSVITWLAGLTASDHLPQKLLVLHQFRLSMITDEHRLDTSHDDIAIVIHMDGQGNSGRQAADLAGGHRHGAARGVLRLEELLHQGPSDAEPAADDGQYAAARHDLVSVIGRG